MSWHTEVKRYYFEFLICQELRTCTNSGYQAHTQDFHPRFCLAAFEIKIETKCGVKPGLEVSLHVHDILDLHFV